MFKFTTHQFCHNCSKVEAGNTHVLSTKNPPSSSKGRLSGPLRAMAADEVGAIVEMTYAEKNVTCYSEILRPYHGMHGLYYILSPEKCLGIVFMRRSPTETQTPDTVKANLCKRNSVT